MINLETPVAGTNTMNFESIHAILYSCPSDDQLETHIETVEPHIKTDSDSKFHPFMHKFLVTFIYKILCNISVLLNNLFHTPTHSTITTTHTTTHATTHTSTTTHVTTHRPNYLACQKTWSQHPSYYCLLQSSSVQSCHCRHSWHESEAYRPCFALCSL